MASFLRVFLTCIVQAFLLIYSGWFGSASITREITPEKSIEKGENSSFKIVCYYSMDDSANFTSVLPPDLNITLCTHINFIATPIVDAGIVPGSEKHVELFISKVPIIKKMNPLLKILVTNSGNYTQVMTTPENRTKYAHSALTFVRKFGFDGLDMDWEFPEFSDILNISAHKHNLSLVVKEIRELFDDDRRKNGGDPLMLTMAVSAGADSIAWLYDVPALAKYVDYVSVMSYDRHMYLKDFPFTGHNSPLYRGDHILDEIVFRDTHFVFSTNEWVRRGMKKWQVMGGIPTYAHTYNLLLPEWNSVYAAASGLGRTGDFLHYPDICELKRNSSTVVVWDDVSKVPYLHQDSLWVSYSDTRSVSLKIEYLLQNGFNGVMIYSQNCDDYLATCDGKTKWPLMSTIYNAVKNYKTHSFTFEEKDVMTENVLIMDMK